MTKEEKKERIIFTSVIFIASFFLFCVDYLILKFLIWCFSLVF